MVTPAGGGASPERNRATASGMFSIGTDQLVMNFICFGPRRQIEMRLAQSTPDRRCSISHPLLSLRFSHGGCARQMVKALRKRAVHINNRAGSREHPAKRGFR